MNPQDPLSQLRDIHLPETGGFWPPAPGWWILAIALVAMLSALIWLFLQRRKKNRWYRSAHAELTRLERSATAAPSWFTQLNTLLKQAARMRYPDQHPEALSGDAWVEFLLATAPRDRVASRPVVEALVHSSWQPTVSAEPSEALAFARLWLGGQKC
ncbi:DUF4381 domain-containing protein [Marinobacter sp. F3R08]|uniref:DUF4381 domain-containing protein n=1 Tax=Marinobacter sp. F3R08 TaxID=2841559 RepID=UPI001C0910BB|nr:DUF4381 domain-containing protein [Marinobacter sp. F3R08]MBU2955291.1 DUF4381 domain-containing protein [Marinobacter sp. F3R08]